MQIVLKRPDLEQFIEEQLSAGRFDSAEQLIEAALHRLMLEQSSADDDLDERTIAAILRADAQCERGEGRDLAEVAAELRKRAREIQDCAVRRGGQHE